MYFVGGTGGFIIIHFGINEVSLQCGFDFDDGRFSPCLTSLRDFRVMKCPMLSCETDNGDSSNSSMFTKKIGV